MTEDKEFLAKWLNKTMRIRITDDRILVGSFLCTDKDQNIILGSSQEYINLKGMN
jgi:N-alpha-acetyltransferase 38, NatC auxiliary subunit